MKIRELFDILKSTNLDLCNLQEGDTPFVSRTSKNNGISSYVTIPDNITPFPSGAISVALVGSIMCAFIQDRPFITSQNMAILIPRSAMSIQTKLWYCLCIRANEFRYSYGRNAHSTFKDLDVPNPPDWVETIEIPTYPKVEIPENETLDTSDWQKYYLPELFDFAIGKGPDRVFAESNPGETPYITSSAMNNGSFGNIDHLPTHPEGVITVAKDGSVGEAFYQPKPFCANSHIVVFTPKFEMTQNIALFICTLIRMEKFKYSYGRAWGLDRMKQSYIKLPTKNNQPDYEFIENYMAKMPYLNLLEK